MQWLTPMTALIAAALAVPLLVLLYFLKLKRTEMVVSSTLLWKRAVRDLQVNAPFQRLRRNLLLLLQLLAIAAVLAAVAGPMLSLTTGPGQRYILLIDRSGSMSAVDCTGDGDAKISRLALAARQAKLLVESLRTRSSFSLRDTSDMAMVIAFDDHAEVICNFTSDKRRLRSAIDSIRPTDGGSRLAEAVATAQAFARSEGEEMNNRSAQQPGRLELFSDGRIADLGKLSIPAELLRFHAVGRSGENLAITASQARRSYETPEQVNVFAEITNFSPAEANCDVQLSVDGNVRAVRSVTVPALRSGAGDKPSIPGSVTVSFSLAHGGRGVFEIRQLRPDVLSGDDAAWAIVEPPGKLAVLLVSAGNAALEMALRSCPLARLDVVTPKRFRTDADDLAAGRYDVIVLAGDAPDKLPRGRYLIFGRPGPATGVAATEQLSNQFIADWRGRHPVLQYVNLGELFASRCWKLRPPREAQVLAEFADAPALVLLRKAGRSFLLAGFDPLETNWPFEPGFVMFCYNAVNYLGLELGRDARADLRVGEPLRLEGLKPNTAVRVRCPGGETAEFRSDAGGTFRYPATHRVGVYHISGVGRGGKAFAVNMSSRRESDVKPVSRIVISGRAVASQQGRAGRANVELWPILVLLALLLVCIEWFVYNSRVRI